MSAYNECVPHTTIAKTVSSPFLVFISPWPHWPSVLSPVARTLPRLVSSSVCRAPRLTATMVWPPGPVPEIGVGIRLKMGSV